MNVRKLKIKNKNIFLSQMSFYKAPYKSTRTIPLVNNMFTSSISTGRRKLQYFSEYIDLEYDEQEKIFKMMECDPELAKLALDALRKALESSPIAN